MADIDERYARGKIYTIRNIVEPELVYVGSTIKNLSGRFGGHKEACKRIKVLNPKSRMFYKLIENDDWSNWYIELYELFPCNSKQELTKREGNVTKEIGNLNVNIASRTEVEYRKDNQEKIAKHKKQNYQNNQSKIAEQQKQYQQNNKAKLAEYQRLYCQENKAKLQKQQNQRRRDNKAKKLAELAIN